MTEQAARSAGCSSAHFGPEFAQQQAGYEEAAQHEEHVHADEAAGEPRRPKVVADDAQHRDGTQSFEIASNRARALANRAA